jgi:hypothetical protein
MYHVFLTRIAVDLYELTAGRQKAFPPWRVHRNIMFWHAFGSKFYTAQTVEQPFEVRLIYSPRYEHLVHKYTYPPWVKFYPYVREAALQTWRDYSDVPRPAMFHRIDADDQYSRDFIEVMEAQAPRFDALTLLQHRQYIQFDAIRRRTAIPDFTNQGPHFSSMRLVEGEIQQAPDPLHIQHGSAHRRYRAENSYHLPLALESVHGRNWMNRRRRARWTAERRSRFVYYGD